DISTADTHADAEAVSGVNLRQVLREPGKRKADPGQQHADDGKAARAEAVGEGAAQDPEPEIEKSGERKYQRDRAPRRSKIPLQGFDEGAERIGAAEADEGDGKGGSHHEPAVEDSRTAQGCIGAHDSFLFRRWGGVGAKRSLLERRRRRVPGSLRRD